SEARMKKDITYLASDELEGRGPTTEGLKKAGEYIAEQYKKAGLKPGNPDGTYFQNFAIPCTLLDEPATLKLTGPKGQELLLEQGKNFAPQPLGASGKTAGAGVVFAGYGVTIKNKDGGSYDDYENIDAEGKVVVVIRGCPRQILDAVKAGPNE